MSHVHAAGTTATAMPCITLRGSLRRSNDIAESVARGNAIIVVLVTVFLCTQKRVLDLFIQTRDWLADFFSRTDLFV
jgi:hypothetical protein